MILQRDTASYRARLHASLAHYGFGMTNREDWQGPLLSPEELFIHVVEHVRDPRMLAGLVVVLYNAHPDYTALLRHVQDHACANRAGFILSKIARVWGEGQRDLHQTLSALDAMKDGTRRLASCATNESCRLEELMVEQASDPDAKRWHVYGRIDDADLQKYFMNFVTHGKH